MGGARHEISDATTTVALEMAWFDTVGIGQHRRPASGCAPRRRPASSVASTRTACRHVDRPLRRAARRDLPRPRRARRRRRRPRRRRCRRATARATVRISQVNRILGTDARGRRPAAAARPDRLHGHAAPATSARSSLPSWRPDSTEEIDVDRGGRPPLRLRPPRQDRAEVDGARPAVASRQQRRRRLRQVLLGLGIAEAMPNPFLAPDDLDRGRPDGRRAARSPTRSSPRRACCARRCGPGCSRRSPTTSRTAAPASRCSRSATSTRPATGELPDEHEALGVVLAGAEAPGGDRRVARARRRDGRRRARRPGAGARRPAPDPLGDARRPGATSIGAVGEVAPRRARRVRHHRAGRVLELDLDRAARPASRSRRSGSRPAATRRATSTSPSSLADDVAGRDGSTRRSARAPAALLVDLDLFDVYRGAGVGRRARAASPTGCGCRRPTAPSPTPTSPTCAPRSTAAAAKLGAELRGMTATRRRRRVARRGVPGWLFVVVPLVLSAALVGGISIAVRSSSDDGDSTPDLSGPAAELPAVTDAATELLGTPPPAAAMAAALGTAYGEVTVGLGTITDEVQFAERFERLPDAEAKLRRAHARGDPGPAHAGGRGRRTDGRPAQRRHRLRPGDVPGDGAGPRSRRVARDQALAVLPFSMQDLEGSTRWRPRSRPATWRRSPASTRPQRRRRRRARQLDRLPDGQQIPADGLGKTFTTPTKPSCPEPAHPRTDDRFPGCNDLRWRRETCGGRVLVGLSLGGVCSSAPRARRRRPTSDRPPRRRRRPRRRRPPIRRRPSSSTTTTTVADDDDHDVDDHDHDDRHRRRPPTRHDDGRRRAGRRRAQPGVHLHRPARRLAERDRRRPEQPGRRRSTRSPPRTASGDANVINAGDPARRVPGQRHRRHHRRAAGAARRTPAPAPATTPAPDSDDARHRAGRHAAAVRRGGPAGRSSTSCSPTTGWRRSPSTGSPGG